MNKKAFTLAEVLITLGVIGIVAALTMPALIANYQKKVLETRLAKFYSVIQQAYKLSEVDNGERATWTPMPNDTDQKMVDWYDVHLGPYLKTVKVETRLSSVASDGRRALLLYFPDGGALEMTPGASDTFFPEAKTAEAAVNLSTRMPYSGTKLFTFAGPNPYGQGLEEMQLRNGAGGAPLQVACDGIVDVVSKGQHYCGALIQMNGWKIPDDYPFSF